MKKLNIAVLEEQEVLAREAGFIKAADEIAVKVSRARKLAIAYEHFRYVTQEQVDAFNLKLKEKTERPASESDAYRLANPKLYHGATLVCDQLVMTKMEEYAGLPPADVLIATKAAREKGCFDGMEVAEVQPVSTEVKLPDPIVFGRIDCCTDRFFVCEWGTDVSIKDLLKQGEG